MPKGIHFFEIFKFISKSPIVSLIATTAVILLSLSYLAARAGHVLPPLQHTFFCMKYPSKCRSQTKAKAQPLPKAPRIREPQQVDHSREERIDMSLTSTDRQGERLWTILRCAAIASSPEAYFHTNRRSGTDVTLVA